jgi:hypothetical protein
MGHIKVSATRAEQTPAEWLPVGAQIGSLVNTWAGRSDIVAYVGPGAGGPTPACFNPALSEVEVNVDLSFGKGITPSSIGDLLDRDSLFNWPKAAGAIFHEALHARYSKMDLSKASKELTPNEFNAFMSLEETRIERLGVTNFPMNRIFLRACALDLVLHDINENIEKADNIRSIATIAALLSARVDAGSLDADDVVGINTVVIDFLGADTFEKLQSVWRRFQGIENALNPLPLYDLAREWDQILRDLAKERGEELDAPSKADVKMIIAVLSEIIKEIEDAIDTIAIAVADDAQDQQQSEEWKEEVEVRTKAARQDREHKKVADEIFKDTSEAGNTNGSNSRLEKIRKPEAKERAAAVKIAQMLEKAKYRERDAHEIQSILPPGRLRTRAIVQNAAYKAQGSMQAANPWRRTVRKHTDDPTLTVGVMVDISGSMGSAMNPMAVTAWAMSEAARRVQARAAMVYFGQDVFPTLKPGQHLDQINVYTAPDSTEKFDKAFKALDGSLNLLYGNGARLLVVVSDARYTSVETEHAKHWLKECDDKGVAVLWLPFCKSPYLHDAMDLTRGTNAVLLSDVMDPADAAIRIGTAAANALTKIGSKNAA